MHAKTGFFWPLQLTKDIPTIRVLLFGYDALFEPSLGSNQIRLPNVSRKLLQDLINARSEDSVRILFFRRGVAQILFCRKDYAH